MKIERALGLISVLGFWESAARIARSPFFPPVSSIVHRALRMPAALAADVGASLTLILLGFFLAVSVGFPLGVLTGRFPLAERILAPLIDTIRPVPALALFPMFIVVLGLGVESRAAVTFWTAWPSITLNTFQALRQVDRDVVAAARLDGAGEWRLLVSVLLPCGAQTIFTGLRLAMGGAWISVVAAEMLGSNRGLGFRVMVESNNFDFPAMFAGILLIALTGLALNRALVAVQKSLDWGGVYAEVRFGSRPAGRGARRVVRGEDAVRGLQGLRPRVRRARERVLPGGGC